MAPIFRVLLVPGSLRRESTNAAVLRSALACAPATVQGAVYHGMEALPAFNPDADRDPLPPAVEELRGQIRGADALVFSTPEYAGDLPGSFKNLLDWTVGDAQPGSISTKPVAWINVSTRGAAHAHDALRRVLGYVGADIIEPACVELPLTSDVVGEDGLIADRAVRQELTRVLETLAAARRP
ncbi:MAG: NADPH-dependent FMN reductase [Acidimicrobiales bacterium]